MPTFTTRANLRTVNGRGSSLKDAGDEAIVIVTLQIPLSEMEGRIGLLYQRIKKDIDVTFEWFNAGDQRTMSEAGGASWCDYPRHGVCHEHAANGNIPAYWHCKDQPHVSLMDPCEHIKTDTAPEEHAPIAPAEAPVAEAPRRVRRGKAAVAAETPAPQAPQLVAPEQVCHQEGDQWWCAVAAAFESRPCEHVADQLGDTVSEEAVDHVAARVEAVPSDYNATEAAQAARLQAEREAAENVGFIEVGGCDWSPYASQGHCHNEPTKTQYAPCQHIEAEWKRRDNAATPPARELVGATTGAPGEAEIPF